MYISRCVIANLRLRFEKRRPRNIYSCAGNILKYVLNYQPPTSRMPIKCKCLNRVHRKEDTKYAKFWKKKELKKRSQKRNE